MHLNHPEATPSSTLLPGFVEKLSPAKWISDAKNAGDFYLKGEILRDTDEEMKGKREGKGEKEERRKEERRKRLQRKTARHGDTKI